jgi:hypothetical protein
VRYFWFGTRTGPRPTGIPDRMQRYSYSDGFRFTVENPDYVEAISNRQQSKKILSNVTGPEED